MFWENRISGDTKAHGGRDVGAATDFVGLMGEPIHAPFAGKVSYIWFGNGKGQAGWRVQVEGTRFIFQGAHLLGNEGNGWDKKKGSAPKWSKRGLVLWRSVIGAFGFTGDTNGVHIHSVIIDKRHKKVNGHWQRKRMSFAEWLIWRKGIKNVPSNIRTAVNNGKVKPLS